jgi:macrolide transport system ATP-binding/permease protein/lipoprotein-releasing system ATP-binding protein
MNVEQTDTLVDELRRELAAAQSEIRLLRRRLGDAQKTADRTEGELREKLRNAVPHRQSAATPQASMQLGRRLGLWRSRPWSRS